MYLKERKQTEFDIKLLLLTPNVVELLPESVIPVAKCSRRCGGFWFGEFH